jgi:beta-N-acetylhexosaminidase
VLAAVLTAATLLAGHSVLGAPIDALRQGAADAPEKVLVVGVIHGNERAGRAVIGALRTIEPPAGVQLWTVMSVNPDGAARDTRQNARGVDLNRNLPNRWTGGGRPFDTYYPGPRPLSEPETRALTRLVRELRPDVTIYYHQHMNLVDLSRGADPAIVRAYARRTGMRAARIPFIHGTATSWQNATFRSDDAFVVELPAGSLTAAAARRHARAAIATVPPATARAAAAATKPPIVWSPIPFGAKRKREMAAYSYRHYGDHTALLGQVKTIVEHFTATTTYSSAFNTFAGDVRDPELGELPGTCAHFVIDKDGTIHQLVRLRYRCRHTVGLNDRSIGIEHVGLSDAQVMGDAPQLRASLRLTRWLQARYHVPTKYVIGHAESLSSPFHHEKVMRLRTQTHGDMQHATMQRYRRLL